MTDTAISKTEAARRLLDCAIRLRLREEDSLAAHTLAYAAFGILRDLVRDRGHEMEDVLAVLLNQSSKMGREFSGVPNFLKHADRDPEGMLAAHSPSTVHLTLAFAIRLWVELGGQETPEMQEFAELPDPYKPGYRASEFVRFLQERPVLSEQDEAVWRARLWGIATTTSTG
jgi:hypothetical protein